MGASEIHAALESLPCPVTVVSVGRGGVDNALTVSWICPASFDPPMVALAIDKRHYSEELLRSTRTFVVNVLGEDQKKLAGHFALQAIAGEDKFKDLATREAAGGARILSDAVAWLDCEVEAIHPTGDHLLVVGKVLDGAVQREVAGLTNASGIRYRRSKP